MSEVHMHTMIFFFCFHRLLKLILREESFTLVTSSPNNNFVSIVLINPIVETMKMNKDLNA
jgi:hypothetical protein